MYCSFTMEKTLPMSVSFPNETGSPTKCAIKEIWQHPQEVDATKLHPSLRYWHSILGSANLYSRIHTCLYRTP